MLAPASLLSSFWVHNLDYFISVSSKLNEISIWAESNLLGSGPICHHISPGVCSITALFLSNQIRPRHLTCSGEKEREGERGMETERDRGEWLTLVCVHQIKLFGWGKKINKRKKEQQDQSVFLRRPSWRHFLWNVFNKEGINASTIPTITRAVVRKTDKQTSQSSLQRDTEMAFNKAA